MLCKALKDDGVHVEAPACDVTKADSLMSVLAHCAESMPPIKGCIQASMVLKVRNWMAQYVPAIHGFIFA